jgi:hypothetical protein
MAIRPDERYTPPPAEACERFVFDFSLPEAGHVLKVRILTYRGKVVDFAVTQILFDGADWVNVARIDCCHGYIHRHQFDRDGNDIWDHRKIMDIPHENGWEVVDRGYEEALDVMQNEWEDNLGRWHGN